ncbi:MAG: reverse transcriptase [Bacteroidetes bacterium HGW-Bacteroidetes-11]|jgi:retron-type reverse transcriptase|nr:MAG: reverse transcriptase [Bacteroidetes bacterium HGW-Bacteroidetes-11]
MKRITNLYETLCSMDNLILADANARKGKRRQYGVIKHDRVKEDNLLALQRSLIDRSFHTSEYHVFKINHNGKEREIYRLPYFPDRIVHHAVMNVVKQIWVSAFTHDTYSCIEGRGIHQAVKKVKAALVNEPETRYCLKLDIRKYYPSIDHNILKALIRRKIKDDGVLWLLDEIIDSAPGLPIGNYLSQYLANLYLAYFDHYVKEVLKVKYYFRYADDIVILSSSKIDLHALFAKIESYLNNNLNLTVKSNYQIFPVSSRGIDFLGYVFFHTHTLLRKSIKQRFARNVARKGISGNLSIAAYNGWAMHCNSKNLLKKLLNENKRETSAAQAS